MDLERKTVLILGGSGLVGEAVARRLLPERPDRIVLVALYEEEVRLAAERLSALSGDTAVVYDWGNVFVPAPAARVSRSEMLEDDDLRRLVVADILDRISPEILERSFLYQLLVKHRPDAVVDCINTATAFAYQDVFTSARELLSAAEKGVVTKQDLERHVLTLTMPQLIRHTQIAVEAMRLAKTGSYVKIGTSGTGGMGFNIPYTHSEERPSRTLLTKSAVAGAQSILLFLMARTPGAPDTHEVKPTAAIAWRKITHGPIRRGGKTLRRFECDAPVSIADAFGDGAAFWRDTGQSLESVYIDVGENGVFARDEFETVTSMGQMEFITAEDVANYVVMELTGRTTGKDIIAALDSATAGPTYNAGVLRAKALSELDKLQEEHGLRSVAFEMLGPPRLTKMLYESFILSRLRPNVRALAESDASVLSAEASQLVAGDPELRSVIISVGLPILIGDGKVYRGGEVIMPPVESDPERIIGRGWVDLRVPRCETWISRARLMVEQHGTRVANQCGTGSDLDWYALRPEDPIVPARFATWVFRYQDDGERIKR